MNKNKDCEFHGDYVGRDQITTNIIMFQDNEREFVVTYNANIKPVAYFTGRETELQELRKRIEEGRKSVLVSGMGGIGKTHICRKLFEEYLKNHGSGKSGDFRHIGYVEYNGDMGDSLSKCLKYKKQDTPELDKEAAWRELEYLASDGKLLLFVDNVNVAIGEDLGLKRLMSIPGAIVLTSRRRIFSKEFESYRIGFLSIGQCRKIYERIRFEDSGKRVAEEEVADLEYVIEKLAAMHTITVEFLAHLARTKCWTVQRLRDELDRNKFRLEYKDEDDKLVNIQESYETLYDMSKLNGAEQNILEAFSLFPYIPLAVQTCNEWLLADAGVSEDDDILTGLYRKGWLQFDLSEESYTLHPVFAQFIYEKQGANIEKHFGLLRACQECIRIPNNGLAVECKKYIPFAEKIVEKIGIDIETGQVEFIVTFAETLHYIAEYEKAMELYLKILNVKKNVHGEKHMDTATSYNNLAKLCMDQGEYGKAKKFYKRSIHIRENILGQDHVDTATSYNDLAEIYMREGEYKKAEELYEKSLRIRESVLGERHPDTASSYNNLAGAYEKQRKYERVEELYEKSLWIRKCVLGENHPDTATSYNNLAYVRERQREYKTAEELYERSLRIRKRALGENHPKTAISYNNLAGVYERQGEYETAIELHEKSLQIRKNVLGENHPDTAHSYNNLAVIYYKQKKYVDALSCFTNAYKILHGKFGLRHPNTQTAYKNLKRTYLQLNLESSFEQWLEEKLRE